MKNRFESKKRNKGTAFLYTLPLLLSLVIIVSFVFGIRSVSQTTADKQLESLENALSRSIAQCYAVEGMYPPDLDYLKEHYIEGIVFWKDGEPGCKIKRSDFGFEWNRGGGR